MAQIMNINTAPVVSPDGAYLVALKEGRISRIDGKILSQDSEVTSYVDTKAEEITKSYTAEIDKLNKEIDKLNKEIVEIKGIINGMVLAAQTAPTPSASEENDVVEQANEESSKAKSKKSKK